MKEQEYINNIIERFFDGETSLAEEEQLFDYFGSHDVPPEMQPLKLMFEDMKAIKSPTKAATAMPHTAKVQPLHHRWHKALSLAAAIFAGLIVVSTWFGHTQENYVAYVYGQKVTDREAVMQEVHTTMNTMLQGNTNVDAELKSLFE